MDRDVFFRRFTPTGAAGASSRQVPSAEEVSSLRSPAPLRGSPNFFRSHPPFASFAIGEIKRRDCGTENSMFCISDLPKGIPALRTQADAADAIAYAHLRLPGTKLHWFLIEWDGASTARALVLGSPTELDYVDLATLTSLRARLTFQLNNSPDEGGYRIAELPAFVQLDSTFKPTPISALRAQFAVAA
ncbi:MAG: hypothetical protein IT381_32810 [Deltaproteobacteria bacterium]|nr:hypothetical protein [Deltaproteobacteria bacterium]